MKYITGIHALNLVCGLNTCGDWHRSALQWKDITWADSDKMFFGDYGIEAGHKIPLHDGEYFAANHIRALLDYLETGNFAAAQGMNQDFIGNDKYDQEIFGKVCEMRHLPNWEQIHSFMGKEYRMKWLNYLRKAGLFVQPETARRESEELPAASFLRSPPAGDFILKGGTALRLCYGLDRVPETVELDALNLESVFAALERFCNANGFSYDQNPAARRVLIDCGASVLPVQWSCPRERMANTTVINGLRVYPVSAIAARKTAAYAVRERIRDLYDLVFLCERFWERLDLAVRTSLRNVIDYKGSDQCEYLILTQPDAGVDPDVLRKRFRAMTEKLGLLQ